MVASLQEQEKPNNSETESNGNNKKITSKVFVVGGGESGRNTVVSYAKYAKEKGLTGFERKDAPETAAERKIVGAITGTEPAENHQVPFVTRVPATNGNTHFLTIDLSDNLKIDKNNPKILTDFVNFSDNKFIEHGPTVDDVLLQYETISFVPPDKSMDTGNDTMVGSMYVNGFVVRDEFWEQIRQQLIARKDFSILNAAKQFTGRDGNTWWRVPGFSESDSIKRAISQMTLAEGNIDTVFLISNAGGGSGTQINNSVANILNFIRRKGVAGPDGKRTRTHPMGPVDFLIYRAGTLPDEDKSSYFTNAAIRLLHTINGDRKLTDFAEKDRKDAYNLPIDGDILVSERAARQALAGRGLTQSQFFEELDTKGLVVPLSVLGNIFDGRYARGAGAQFTIEEALPKLRGLIYVCQLNMPKRQDGAEISLTEDKEYDVEEDTNRIVGMTKKLLLPAQSGEGLEGMLVGTKNFVTDHTTVDEKTVRSLAEKKQRLESGNYTGTLGDDLKKECFELELKINVALGEGKRLTAEQYLDEVIKQIIPDSREPYARLNSKVEVDKTQIPLEYLTATSLTMLVTGPTITENQITMDEKNIMTKIIGQAFPNIKEMATHFGYSPEKRITLYVGGGVTSEQLDIMIKGLERVYQSFDPDKCMRFVLENDLSCKDFVDKNEAPYYNKDSRVRTQEQFRNAVDYALNKGVMFYGDTVIDNMDYVRRLIWGGRAEKAPGLYRRKQDPQPVIPDQKPAKPKRKFFKK